MTMGLTPYRGPAKAPPFAAPIIPGIPGTTVPVPAASSPTAQPEPSSGAVEEASVAGVAEDQLAGTDRPPTADASPSAPAAPPPDTELTRAPSAAAAPATGVTSLVVAVA